MGVSAKVRLVLALLVVGLPGLASAQEAMEAEKKYTIRFETTEHKRYCKASVWVEYNQYDTVASYDGEIKNEDCGASGGSYTITVRYQDESGEVHSVDSEHTWHRDDDQTVIFRGEQSIGENVDLIRVRARKIQCVCDDVETPGVENESKGEKE
jgi:hypothetical protein